MVPSKVLHPVMLKNESDSMCALLAVQEFWWNMEKWCFALVWCEYQYMFTESQLLNFETLASHVMLDLWLLQQTLFQYVFTYKIHSVSTSYSSY